MTFYAHTVTGESEAQWEPLVQHLEEVADLAARYGLRFGAGDLAGLSGYLHDLGKYSVAFQQRLHGSPGRVDHSTAGAAWARHHLSQAWGRLLAHVVAGHHAGLGDDLLRDEGRVMSAIASLPDVEAAAQADGLVLRQQVSAPTGMRQVRGELGFIYAFLTRMLFSCLVDADRTAAAAFDARSTGQSVEEERYPSIPELEAALLASAQRRGLGRGVLNELRDRVRHAAMEQAKGAQGVFTLTVPTGGGKTLTSLAFALAHARRHGLDRVVVVIPFTAVVEQTAAAFRDALGSLGGAVLEHHSAFELTDEARWATDRVGPERLRLAMDRWDMPIVVTTAVQFFESLFSNRPSRCRKLHSLARSVIIVDEAQTMPLALLRPCVTALRELVRNYAASVVLCTATQPALTASTTPGQGFPGGFMEPKELAPCVTDLFAALQRVTVRDIGPQTDTALAERLAATPQALCIVNQRAHARALFGAIRDLPGARHLSTCMHAAHRARVLAELRVDLTAERPCRLVSTSLIEAGVDVDFGLVLRASAGLDQIAQAAGRCNREGRWHAKDSEVLVFSAPEYPVIRQLVANAAVGEEVLRRHAQDPLAPPAIQAFFETLYWKKGADEADGGELDRNQVLRMCAEHAGDLNFPFASIAEAMRFIDDTMVPVIVPLQEDEPGEVDHLLGPLRGGARLGNVMRRLGRYNVGVPRRIRAGMIKERVAEVIREDLFGDQFVVLRNTELYTPETGLTWDDLTFRTAEGLIVA